MYEAEHPRHTLKREKSILGVIECAGIRISVLEMLTVGSVLEEGGTDVKNATNLYISQEPILPGTFRKSAQNLIGFLRTFFPDRVFANFFP